MTAITRRLPWFIKDAGVSIIGEKCYTTLVENLEIFDVACLKYSLSKGLGIGIVVGGSIMKVPQLILILRAHSAHGLSLPSYILETTAQAITLFYSFRYAFPFSTYGENLFLTIQNILITFLIILYAPSKPLTTLSLSKSTQLLLFTMSTFFSLLILFVIPLSTLAPLLLLSLPLALISKLPQIRKNYKAKATGQLSLFAVASQILGCTARLFTTFTEVGDPLVAAGYFLALALNAILGIQMWVYWGRGWGREGIELEEGKEKNGFEDAKFLGRPVERGPEISSLYTPKPWHVKSPDPEPIPGGSRRHYGRKVD